MDKGVDALFINDIHVLYESDDTALDEPLSDDDDALPVGVLLTTYILLHCDIILSRSFPLDRGLCHSYPCWQLLWYCR